MPSEFDDAFAEIRSMHEASARTARIEAMERQREQDAAGRIADPVLRRVGLDASRKLIDLKVPSRQHHIRGGVFQRHIKLNYWAFDEPFLNLSVDGYFFRGYSVLGPEGLDLLVRDIRFDRWTDVQG